MNVFAGRQHPSLDTVTESVAEDDGSDDDGNVDDDKGNDDNDDGVNSGGQLPFLWQLH